ncbi:hypothetical protein ACOKM3_42510 [Streptomyces sp. BH106]
MLSAPGRGPGGVGPGVNVMYGRGMTDSPSMPYDGWKMFYRPCL